jgi:cytochrome c
MLKRPTIIVVALLTANGIAGAADLTAGRTLFKVCAPCHEIGVNARNRVGPILNGLDGRPAGTVPGYSYSQATKHSGIVWREAVFKQYLKNPSAMVPGSKMFFTGILDEEGLEDLWNFVRQYGPDGIVRPPTEQKREAPASESK